jgi:hypothetical protein
MTSVQQHKLVVFVVICWQELRRAKRFTCQRCPTPDMFPVTCTTFCVLNCYQLVYCLLRYFLVRIRIAIANSSKHFQCEAMFENEHTSCVWIHHVSTFAAFAQQA